jgi:hypothetical protein
MMSGSIINKRTQRGHSSRCGCKRSGEHVVALETTLKQPTKVKTHNRKKKERAQQQEEDSAAAALHPSTFSIRWGCEIRLYMPLLS